MGEVSGAGVDWSGAGVLTTGGATVGWSTGGEVGCSIAGGAVTCATGVRLSARAAGTQSVSRSPANRTRRVKSSTGTALGKESNNDEYSSQDESGVKIT
jgi:hypothetical protein